MGSSVGRFGPTSFRRGAASRVAVTLLLSVALTGVAGATGVTPGLRHARLAALSVLLPAGSTRLSHPPAAVASRFNFITMNKAPWNYVDLSAYAVVAASVRGTLMFLRQHPPNRVRLVGDTQRTSDVHQILFERRSTHHVLALRIREYVTALTAGRTALWIVVRANRYPTKPLGDLVGPGYRHVRISSCATARVGCRQWQLQQIEKINVLREIVNEQFVEPTMQICPANFVTPTYVQFFRRGQLVPSVTAVVEVGGCGTIAIVDGSTTQRSVLSIGPRFLKRMSAVAGPGSFRY